MIPRFDATSRTLDVNVSETEAEKLGEAGFHVTVRDWKDSAGFTHRARMNAAERDALALARGALSAPPRVDTTKSDAYYDLSARQAALMNAAPEDRLAVVLRSRAWKGSTIDERADGTSIRHPSGARMFLRREA
jgi:hypothetical protein